MEEKQVCVTCFTGYRSIHKEKKMKEVAKPEDIYIRLNKEMQLQKVTKIYGETQGS